jgi:two-component system, OmpR family, phosphate regulon sensor histidine kinase PhoR
MWWLITLLAVVAALGFYVWRKWIAPLREIEQVVRQIGRGEQPRTFLLRGAKEAQRIGVALEQILKRQRELNRQISERLAGDQAIFSAMQDGLLVLDGERRVALFNRAFEALFKVSQNALGAPLLEAVREPVLQRLISETCEKRMPSRADLTVGQHQWQVDAMPMESGNGAKAGTVILFHDITSLKRADEIRRDFVANVSHELRTPLSILRGYIETMLDDPKMPRGELVRILEVMDQHSKRLGLLANDLLTLAQLESGSSLLHLSEIDMLRFFSDLVRDWEKKFSVKRLKVMVNVSDDCPVIWADEGRLREVFDNLLDNALKYSNERGTIGLGAERRRNEIIVTVSDTGIGISHEDLPRIFERFYRADKARSRELGGTGLGLSIVKHIAQLHGGRVEADSALRKGTTIRLVLPAVTQS